MNVSLTRELERLVEEKVSSGMYQTASEVVREGLRLLNERDRARELGMAVREGFAEIDRGEFEEFDEDTIGELAERVKARGMKRLKARGKSRTR